MFGPSSIIQDITAVELPALPGCCCIQWYYATE